MTAVPISDEETDQLERSNKKIKGANGLPGSSDNSSSLDDGNSGASPVREKSPYRDILCGIEADGDEEMSENHNLDEAEGELEDEYVATSDSVDEGEDDDRWSRIRFSAAKKKSFWKPWKFSLICKVLGRKVGFNYLSSGLHKFWQRKGTMKIIDLENYFYLVKFSAKEDYVSALQRRPWMVADHLVSLARWHPNFDPYDFHISTITAWVRFPDLPIEYYNNQALLKLGNLVGKALYVDKTTLNASRGKYAQVCVKIDLQKTLLAKYRLKNRIHRIQYEGLHNICFSCGLFGHNKVQCLDKNEERMMDNELENNEWNNLI